MIDLYDFETRYKIGKPIFDKIFNLNYKDIQSLFQRMFPDLEHKDFKFSDTKVEKISIDDDPKQINIFDYDRFEITPFGINYKARYEEMTHLRYFDEFFKLDF